MTSTTRPKTSGKGSAAAMRLPISCSMSNSRLFTNKGLLSQFIIYNLRGLDSCVQLKFCNGRIEGKKPAAGGPLERPAGQESSSIGCPGCRCWFRTCRLSKHGGLVLGAQPIEIQNKSLLIQVHGVHGHFIVHWRW